jgi:hypothetical protein
MKNTADLQKMINEAKTKMDLYDVAGILNNHPKHIKVDKVTIMGFMDQDQAKAHCQSLLNSIVGEA